MSINNYVFAGVLIQTHPVRVAARLRCDAVGVITASKLCFTRQNRAAYSNSWRATNSASSRFIAHFTRSQCIQCDCVSIAEKGDEKRRDGTAPGENGLPYPNGNTPHGTASAHSPLLNQRPHSNGNDQGRSHPDTDQLTSAVYISSHICLSCLADSTLRKRELQQQQQQQQYTGSLGRNSQAASATSGMTDSMQRAGFVAVRDLPPPAHPTSHHHHHHHNSALPSPQFRHHYGERAGRDVTQPCGWY